MNRGEVIESIKKSKNYLKYKITFDEKNDKFIYNLNDNKYEFFIQTDTYKYSLTCSYYTDIKNMIVSINKKSISDEKINLSLLKLINWINSTNKFLKRKEIHIKKLNKIITSYVKRNYKTESTINLIVDIKKDVKHSRRKPKYIPFDTRKNITEINYEISTSFIDIDDTTIYLTFLYEKGVLTLTRIEERFSQKDISKIIRAEKLKNLLNF